MKSPGMSTVVVSLAGFWSGTASVDRAAADELYEYGEYLSSECTTCHKLDGKASGIPSITGWDVEDFTHALQAYRDGSRENQAMQSVARRLNDGDIEALAVFFHRQGR